MGGRRGVLNKNLPQERGVWIFSGTEHDNFPDPAKSPEAMGLKSSLYN